MTSSLSLKKKLSDAELESLEDQWFEDEEFGDDDMDHWVKGPDGRRRPPEPKYKSEMVFVGLKGELDEDDTSKWSGRLSDVLNSGGVLVKAYPVEPGRALFVLEHGTKDLEKVKQFMLEQPEVADFEWNQQKFYPSSKTSKKNKKSTKSKKQEHDESTNQRIEAIRQALASGASIDEIKQINEQDALIDESLGGAGGPIPAEHPDEL